MSRQGSKVCRSIIAKLATSTDKNRIFKAAERLKAYNEARRADNRSHEYVTDHLPEAYLRQKNVYFRGSNKLEMITSAMAQWLRAFALEAGWLGSILSLAKPKTSKLVSAVTLAKRSPIKCSAEDEINRE